MPFFRFVGEVPHRRHDRTFLNGEGRPATQARHVFDAFLHDEIGSDVPQYLHFCSATHGARRSPKYASAGALLNHSPRTWASASAR